MENNIDLNLLDQLCAEIEKSWIEHRDPSVVDRLASEHPTYSDELYEFLTMLVSGESDVPEEVSRHMVAATNNWLAEEGLGAAKRAAHRERKKRTKTSDSGGNDRTSEELVIPESGEIESKSFIKFLHSETGNTVDAVAEQLDNMTHEFLILVSRNPDIVPIPVRQNLARQCQQVWGINYDSVLAALENSQPVNRAASRSRPYRSLGSFDDLLNRSGLSPGQKSHWNKIAEE